MRKTITTLALGIIMLSLASAMYAGENMTFETNMTNPVYTVTGNQSSLEGLNVSYENGNITIITVSNYKPDNFTLIFFNNETTEIIRTIYTGGGGGGSRTRYVDKNVTVYVPEYIEAIKEVEVEKVVNSVEYVKDDNGFKLWHVLLAIVVGGLFACFVVRSKNE